MSTISTTILDLRAEEATSKAGSRWTPEEDNNLIEEVNNGKTIKEISILHKRTENACKIRVIEKIIYPIYNKNNLNELSSKYNIEACDIERHLIKLKNKENEKGKEKKEKEKKEDINQLILEKLLVLEHRITKIEEKLK